jgi:NAD(P)H-nitrite reductase large subunit
MKPACSLSPCSGCPDRVVCRCFGVKESTIVQAITTLGLRTVKEIRKHTEAGDGCTCCHADLHRLLDEHAAILTAEAV